ncbi:MAG: hypothetical protein WC651_00070 [Candidatus Gracilibacteria bacterium]
MNKKALIALLVVVGLVAACVVGWFAGGENLMGAIRRGNKKAYNENMTYAQFIGKISAAGGVMDPTKFEESVLTSQITRGDAAKLIYQAFPFEFVTPTSQTFVDVKPEDLPYYNYVETLASYNIFEVSGGSFAAGQPLWATNANYWMNQVKKVKFEYITYGQFIEKVKAVGGDVPKEFLGKDSDSLVPRGEATKLLFESFIVGESSGVKVLFSDVPYANPFSAEIYTLANYDIPGGEFKPDVYLIVPVADDWINKVKYPTNYQVSGFITEEGLGGPIPLDGFGEVPYNKVKCPVKTLSPLDGNARASRDFAACKMVQFFTNLIPASASLPTFSDIKFDNPSAIWVETLAYYGVLGSSPVGKFLPNEDITLLELKNWIAKAKLVDKTGFTRGELDKILEKYSSYKATPGMYDNEIVSKTYAPCQFVEAFDLEGVKVTTKSTFSDISPENIFYKDLDCIDILNSVGTFNNDPFVFQKQEGYLESLFFPELSSVTVPSMKKAEAILWAQYLKDYVAKKK